VGRAGPAALSRRQDLLNVSRNSSTPWFWVVTNPLKLGFGMPHRAKVTGIEPATLIAVAVRCAVSVKMTCWVWPPLRPAA
jgi:hypothetical protein